MTIKMPSQMKRAIRKYGIYRSIAKYRFRNEPNVVFVWVPKAAGTSIWNAVAKNTRRVLHRPTNVATDFPQCGIASFGHQSYLQLVEGGFVSREYDQNSFKFCFVRNPFDRTVSLFHYLKKTGDLHENTTFHDFCYLIQDRAFEKVGLYNHIGLSQCNPQTDWVCDSGGEVFVDFIGRYENLLEDFSNLCERIGCKRVLPHLNQSLRSHYSSYYTDETTRIISEFYASDFEQFGYPFKHEP